jgi:hypothetical protein
LPLPDSNGIYPIASAEFNCRDWTIQMDLSTISKATPTIATKWTVLNHTSKIILNVLFMNNISKFKRLSKIS